MAQWFIVLFLSVASVIAHSAEIKECGSNQGINYCYYMGDPDSRKLIYYLHGYGDNVNSWGLNRVTKAIQTQWQTDRTSKPHVVTVSRGRWWYTEKEHGQDLDGFVTWFESSRFSFDPHRILYGESMGAHNAYRWVLDSPRLFSRMALTCPAFPKFFVKDAPLGPWAGLFEFFADQIIGASYSASSQPDFNPLLHSISEGVQSTISHAHVVVSEIDGYGFYDGGMALYRLLSRESGLQVSLEVQRINHCEHEASQLARFLIAD